MLIAPPTPPSDFEFESPDPVRGRLLAPSLPLLLPLALWRVKLPLPKAAAPQPGVVYREKAPPPPKLVTFDSADTIDADLPLSACTTDVCEALGLLESFSFVLNLTTLELVVVVSRRLEDAAVANAKVKVPEVDS
eukprot:GILK01031479.1.p1 GENE.GILK01031479.1~~GILK01031479.1.p1  ORF type:complete len:135 (-),score=17.83 GILK01031479.1:3-407(-)